MHSIKTLFRLFVFSLVGCGAAWSCAKEYAPRSYLYVHSMTGPLWWRGTGPWDINSQAATHMDERFTKQNPGAWYLESVHGVGVWSYYGGALYRLIGLFPTEPSSGKVDRSTSDSRLNFVATLDEFNARHVILDAQDYREAVQKDWIRQIRSTFDAKTAEAYVSKLIRGFSGDSMVLSQPVLCGSYPWIRIDPDLHGFALQGSNLFREPYERPDFDKDQYEDNAGQCRYLLRVCERISP